MLPNQATASTPCYYIKTAATRVLWLTSIALSEMSTRATMFEGDPANIPNSPARHGSSTADDQLYLCAEAC
jgi:hypothetical protein